MKPLLSLLPACSVHLQGPLGKILDLVIANRLKKADYPLMVDIFRKREERDGAWRSEFWGKIVRSAVYAWRSTGDAELKAILDATVTDILTTQTPDGRITSYPEERQTSRWDIWGRKYVMLALLAYYQEIDPRPAIKEALIRMADDVIAQTKGNFFYCGEHSGLAASSIMRALVEIYQLSGEPRHLEAVRKLAEKGCCATHNIFRQSEIGALPAELGNGKSYEMTSCFQGLAALAMLEGDQAALDIVHGYYEDVRDYEIAVTGVGGSKDVNGEFWYNGKRRQVRHDCGGCGETCITATWLAFSRTMLEDYADSTIADEMERSLYNALLGATATDGSNFVHINPMLDGNGWKALAPDQIGSIFHTPFDGNDCCRAQGPYGLALAPAVAVMKSDEGYAVNLYEDLVADNVLKISGGYPSNGHVEVTLLAEGDFELALRVPAEFGCKINGIDAKGGQYARLRRRWKAGDVVVLDFDMAPRTVTSPCRGYTATACGPLVMAKAVRNPVNCLKLADGLVDFASAGMTNTPEDNFQVWFPRA